MHPHCKQKLPLLPPHFDTRRSPPLRYSPAGVLPRQFSVGPDGSLLPEPVSALYWQDPELKISLGTSGIAALVPPLWVPVRYRRGGEQTGGICGWEECK